MKKFTRFTVVFVAVLGGLTGLYLASAGYKTSEYRQDGKTMYRAALEDVLAFEKEHLKALAGDTKAQVAVARSYFLGDHIRKNEAKGARWMKRAAENGSPEAVNFMGILHMGGIGVAQDFAKAREWLTKSEDPQAIELALKLQTLQGALDILPPAEKEQQLKATHEAAAQDMRALFFSLLKEQEKNSAQ